MKLDDIKRAFQSEVDHKAITEEAKRICAKAEAEAREIITRLDAQIERNRKTSPPKAP
jgi:hypothetical protein